MNRLSGLGLQLISVSPGSIDREPEREVMHIEKGEMMKPEKRKRHKVSKTK